MAQSRPANSRQPANRFSRACLAIVSRFRPNASDASSVVQMEGRAAIRRDQRILVRGRAIEGEVVYRSDHRKHHTG